MRPLTCMAVATMLLGALAFAASACATSPTDGTEGPGSPSSSPPTNKPAPPNQSSSGDAAATPADGGNPDGGGGSSSGSSGVGPACDTTPPGKRDFYIQQILDTAAKNGGTVPTCPCSAPQCCYEGQSCVNP